MVSPEWKDNILNGKPSFIRHSSQIHSAELQDMQKKLDAFAAAPLPAQTAVAPVAPVATAPTETDSQFQRIEGKVWGVFYIYTIDIVIEACMMETI